MKLSLFSKIALVLSLGLVAYVLTLFSAPRAFPENVVFRVAQDEPAGIVAQRLYEEHIIASPKIFKSLLIFFAYDKTIQPGPYTFDSPESIFSVARRLGSGMFKTDFVKVTFPEGITTKQMGEILKQKISSFDEVTFDSLAKQKEGYLFPDTYYFDPEVTPLAVVEQLSATFLSHTSTIMKNSTNSKDVVILASILEKEGKGEAEQKMIAGILQNRIDKGMLLQVDAPFVFLLGKESKDLTVADLKLDNPYNTYVYKGLPPGPIGNPGIVALKSALLPTTNSYMFYLHDKNGGIHYAKTYEEHLKNKKQYLK